MSFKLLSDHQILALAIDEWLMGLNDDEWEQALGHIEMRIKQRARKKAEQSESQKYGSGSRKNSWYP